MKNNVHSKQIDEMTLDALEKSLSAIQQAILPRVTPLTPKERQTLPKMGEKTLAFVEKCYEFAVNNPGLCPKFLNMEEFKTDYLDARGLFGSVNIAAQIKQDLADTQMTSGSEAFQSALLFYNSAKAAAASNVAGATSVYEELRKRFPNRTHRKIRGTGGNVPE